MFLQPLNLVQKSKSKNEDSKSQKEGDVFSLDADYHKALFLINQKNTTDSIAILENLRNHPLLQPIDDKGKKDESNDTTLSQRNREYSVEMRKCVLINLAKIYSKENDYKTAIARYEELYEFQQSDLNIMFDFGIALFNYGHIIKSYQMFMKCVE